MVLGLMGRFVGDLWLWRRTVLWRFCRTGVGHKFGGLCFCIWGRMMSFAGVDSRFRVAGAWLLDLWRR